YSSRVDILRCRRFRFLHRRSWVGPTSSICATSFRSWGGCSWASPQKALEMPHASPALRVGRAGEIIPRTLLSLCVGGQRPRTDLALASLLLAAAGRSRSNLLPDD